MLKQGAESSFISAKWDEFDKNCKKGLDSFNLNIFKTRYTDDQEQADREILKNWLKENNIEIEVAEYELNQMDELAKAIEKEMKGRTNLKPYTSQ